MEQNMDQRTLIISCVEYYSYLKNMPAHLVFKSFERTEMVSMLVNTLKQFPTMDLGFFLGMVDGLTALIGDAKEDDYNHHDERTDLGLEVVSMLMKAHKMNDVEACTMYYHSKTSELVSEDHTGYYKKPAQEIFDLIEAE